LADPVAVFDWIRLEVEPADLGERRGAHERLLQHEAEPIEAVAPLLAHGSDGLLEATFRSHGLISSHVFEL